MTDNVSTETFYDIPIRIVHSKGTPMIPLVDIATALNYDRSNMTRLLKRNAELFEPYKGLVRLTTPGGEQELVCLSDNGVAGLLIKMDYSRVKDKTFRTKVLDFQRWAFETLNKVMKQELVAAYAHGKSPTIDTINEQLDIADIAVARSGVPKEVAHAMAWALSSQYVGQDLNVYASFIRAQSTPDDLHRQMRDRLLAEPDTDKADYEKHYSLTQVSDYLKKSPETVKKELERLGVTCIENGTKRLTKFGEKYGKTFMVTPGFPYSSRQRPYIKYNPDVLILLRKSFDGSCQQGVLQDGKQS